MGLYEDRFGLRLDDAGTLWLEHDIRSMPLLALPDGTYVVVGGPDVVLEQQVSLEVDSYRVPVMTITGFAMADRRLMPSAPAAVFPFTIWG